MSLGVLNNIAAIYAQNSLNQTQNSLQSVLQQLSSGSRINSGADDAAGLAVADGLHANEAALNQSSQNATAGVGLLQTADGALSQVTNLLNRAVTLATEAANGTLNSNQVGSANQEYQNILSEIGNIGTTTNFNGNNVFSNTAKTVFVSDGTASGATTYSETIGALTSASVGTTAPAAPATTTVTNPAPVAATASAGGVAAFALAAATNTVSGTLDVTVGGTSSAVGAATVVASTAVVQSTATFALGAATDTVGGSLTLAVGASAAATYAITAGSTLASAVTQLNGTASFTAAGLVASQGTGANANKLIITGGTGAAGAATLVDTSTLTDSVGGTAVTSTLAAGTTLAAAVTQLNAQASFSGAGLVASQGTGANANKLIITGPTGVSNALTLTGTSISETTVPTAGAGVDFTAAGVKTLSAATAQSVLTGVTSAIQNIAYQRGTIGANINQLNAASNVASSESVNLTSAESSIRSTNYGQATSDMAKFKVLSETGISALAQANSVQQEVLKLLQ